VLLWHPPATGTLPISPGDHLDHLEVSYGIRDGAWEDGAQTDGACFHIIVAGPAGTRRAIHERCLRLVGNPADHGEQRLSVALNADGPGALIFETDCGGNCAWDWAYWKDIDITR
jgi:hypothetical protein